MRIAMADGATFAFAGLAERWLAPDGEPLDTCTIVTTEANGLIRALHERMPVIVPPAAYARWLDPATEDPADLVASYPAEAMRFHPVSTRVNTVRNDDASLIEPLPAPADAPPAEPELDLEPPRRPGSRASPPCSSGRGAPPVGRARRASAYRARPEVCIHGAKADAPATSPRGELCPRLGSPEVGARLSPPWGEARSARLGGDHTGPQNVTASGP